MFEFLEIMLGKEGYRVSTAEDGEVVPALMEKDHFDLVITDINMPEMDGQTLVNNIRNNSDQASVPVLMVTSEDGIAFSHPYSVNGALPDQRYEGKFKGHGISYHRVLSHWNNDGTWTDNDLWLVYSLNKEDILISRIPFPLPE